MNNESVFTEGVDPKVNEGTAVPPITALDDDDCEEDDGDEPNENPNDDVVELAALAADGVNENPPDVIATTGIWFGTLTVADDDDDDDDDDALLDRFVLLHATQAALLLLLETLQKEHFHWFVDSTGLIAHDVLDQPLVLDLIDSTLSSLCTSFPSSSSVWSSLSSSSSLV